MTLITSGDLLVDVMRRPQHALAYFLPFWHAFPAADFGWSIRVGRHSQPSGMAVFHAGEGLCDAGALRRKTCSRIGLCPTSRPLSWRRFTVRAFRPFDAVGMDFEARSV